jgi:hypothetical protein
MNSFIYSAAQVNVAAVCYVQILGGCLLLAILCASMLGAGGRDWGGGGHCTLLGGLPAV